MNIFTEVGKVITVVVETIVLACTALKRYVSIIDKAGEAGEQFIDYTIKELSIEQEAAITKLEKELNPD